MGLELDLTDPRPKGKKPKGKATPQAWSMAMMRADGYLCGSTEHWNVHAKVTQDLFGFIDFIAVGHGRIIAVQCCATGGLSEHRNKIAIDRYKDVKHWLEEGRGDIQLHGWHREEVETQPDAECKTRWRKVSSVEVIDMGDIAKISKLYFQKRPDPEG